MPVIPVSRSASHGINEIRLRQRAPNATAAGAVSEHKCFVNSRRRTLAVSFWADRLIQTRGCILTGDDFPTRARVAENRILLIEDEPTTREILTRILRGEGYEMDSVATAAAASTCLNLVPYALVVADWVLPDGDGIDVADTAAQLGAKTIVITGYSSELPSRVADRHELLSKAIGYPELLAAIRRAIDIPAAEL